MINIKSNVTGRYEVTQCNAIEEEEEKEEEIDINIYSIFSIL